MENKSTMIIHFITSTERAGAQAVLLDVVRYLQKEGIKQSVIFIHDGDARPEFLVLGVSVYQVKGFLCSYDPFFWYRLYKLMHRLNPTCLHTVLWSAGFCGRIVARLLGIRQVHALHNSFEHNGRLRNILNAFVGMAQVTTIAVSHSVALSLDRAKVFYKEVVVVQNGIDSSELEYRVKNGQRTRQELGLLPEHFVIGSVGRFEHVKNYDLLVQSFALLYRKYPFARLVLVGSGSLESSLKKLAFKLKVRDYVIFVINQPAYGYYPLFDCFALSSYTEGLSVALLEAMGCGIACVVSHAGSVHDAIENENNGLLVRENCPKNFSYALERCMKEKSLKSRFEREAKKAMRERFGSAFKNRQYRQLFVYDSVCARSEQEGFFFR